VPRPIWIALVCIVAIVAVFHDSPLVLSLWHVVQALGNVVLALVGLVTRTST